MIALDDAIGEALGSPVIASRSLGGGDNARSFRVELDDGRTVFAKTQPGAPAGMLTTEAAGLTWLREADAVAVPEVLAASDGGSSDDRPNLLVLEWIDQGHRGDGMVEADLGRRLAGLHRAGASSFGREDHRTTGSRGLPNEPCPTWTEFYATQRLLPLARIARAESALPSAVIADLETVAQRLETVGGPPEPPARLHGDLWAGNRIVDPDGNSWLIDPAAHGGHREFDLAMMQLFGGFGDECFTAYNEVFPLADGWRDRVLLHQIAPLVVHAVKFGGGYRSAASSAIGQYR